MTDCAWCGDPTDAATAGGQPICDECWDAGADMFAPPVFGRPTAGIGTGSV